MTAILFIFSLGDSDAQADLPQPGTLRGTESVVKENVKSMKPDYCKVQEGITTLEAKLQRSSAPQISRGNEN